MIQTWRDFYREHRNAAIVRVTQELHPDCKSKLQIEKKCKLSHQTVLDAYEDLANIQLSPTLFEDRDLLVRLDALAHSDKALPAIYSRILEGEDGHYSAALIAADCNIRRANVEPKLMELEEHGLITFHKTGSGTFLISCDRLLSKRDQELSNWDAIVTSNVFKAECLNDLKTRTNISQLTLRKSLLVTMASRLDNELSNWDQDESPDLSPQREVSASQDDPYAALETPQADASMKDKVLYICGTWNWFCEQPNRNTPKFTKFSKAFMANGEIRRQDRVLRAIADWIDDFDKWDDAAETWEQFLVKADTNTFIKMTPHKDKSRKVFPGVKLGWLFCKEGLDRFENGDYDTFDESFESFDSEHQKKYANDGGYLLPAPIGDSYLSIVAVVDEFAAVYPDLPQVIHPSAYVVDNIFDPTGTENQTFAGILQFVGDDGGFECFQTFIRENDQLICAIARTCEETPLEWLFTSDNSGTLRIKKAIRGEYNKKFGVLSRSTAKARINEIMGDYNNHMLSTGGTMAMSSEAFHTHGTITDADSTLRLIRDFVTENYNWRSRWRRKLRNLKESTIACRSLDELFLV